MAENKPDKEKSQIADKQRGTQDELEILRIIINQSPALRQTVLEKLRATRARTGADKKTPSTSPSDAPAKK